jgi:hypothetical protein
MTCLGGRVTRERAKHYGYGQWERAQLYAIVATYWREGRTAMWVAYKLGIGIRLTCQIFDHLALSAVVDESAQPTPPPDGLPSDEAAGS